MGWRLLDGTGRAGRAGKTVTATSGKRSFGLSFHYRTCSTPHGSKTPEWKESGMSGDECRIHAPTLLADSASRRPFPPFGQFQNQVSLTFAPVQRCPMI